MNYCPHCGHLLKQTLKDGITNCLNCSRVFDSSPKNRLLSGAWTIRKNNLTLKEEIERYGFSLEESIFLTAFVIDNCFSHEELEETLGNFGL